MHEDLVPPDSLDGYSDKQILEWKAEFDVVATLREIGHDVMKLGVRSDLDVVRLALEEWKPHVTFNLLEEFHGVAVYDHHVAAFLELMKQPYTGCNPRGLLLAHDKTLSKQILSYHRIATPRFVVYTRGSAVKPPKRLKYPLFVKSTIEDASFGLSKDSIVHTPDELIARVKTCYDEIGTDVLVEEYIEGRECYVGVIGNQRLQVLPIWELLFTKLPEGEPNIATAPVKWEAKVQKKLGVKTTQAKNLPDGMEGQIQNLCKRIVHSL